MAALLDVERLEKTVAADAVRYSQAAPFPHILIEDFLPAATLQRAISEFPLPQMLDDWRQNDAVDQAGRVAQKLKLGYSDESKLSDTLRQLFHELNSGVFIKYLERLTSIPNILPDPHLIGGGLHQYLPGSMLRVHSDFNLHRSFNLDRRLNLLLYLNPGWDDSWGGDLELWDQGMERCVVRIPPRANHCVVFSTTSTSFHGMPDALACPEGVTRKSLALYYYSNGRPEEERRPRHTTLWQERPDER